MSRIKDVLRDVQAGTLDLDAGVAALSEVLEQQYHESSEQAVNVDHDRLTRTGAAEVIYAESKTTDQVLAAFTSVADRGNNVLATRVSDDAGAALTAKFDSVEYHADAGLATLVQRPPETVSTAVGVVTAGTSDQRVAEEAALTAEFYGSPVLRVHDVGVAGIHRLFRRVDEIRQCRVAIVVAGMEGALPSVVGGLIDKPIIAVPTSVGYGAAFGGIAALLGMLTSCASGVAVVNIDNGFGAGFLANRINRL